MLMNKRISIPETEPESYKILLSLSRHLSTLPLDPKVVELIKIRASQLNGCAFCLDMHLEEALKLGESTRRIFALSAWKDSHLFTDEECCVLKLTEEVTRISAQGVTEETYEQAIAYFGEKGVGQLIMNIVLINAWNRIAVSTRIIYKP